MDTQFKDKTYLVTGGSRGIGEKITLGLLNLGANVILITRDTASTLANPNFEKFQQDSLSIVSADLSIHSQTQSCAERLSNKVSHLSGIVFCAGGAVQNGNFEIISSESWLEAFQLNVLSSIQILQKMLPKLQVTGHSSVVFVGSLSSDEPGYLNPHYSASKAALMNFMKHMSRRFAKDAIRFNAVSAGPVESESIRDFANQIATESGSDGDSSSSPIEFISKTIQEIPLGRLGQPNEVADVVIFLLSNRTSWVTGSNWKIDGGKSRSF